MTAALAEQQRPVYVMTALFVAVFQLGPEILRGGVAAGQQYSDSPSRNGSGPPRKPQAIVSQTDPCPNGFQGTRESQGAISDEVQLNLISGSL